MNKNLIAESIKLKLWCYRWFSLLSWDSLIVKLYGPVLCGKLFLFTQGNSLKRALLHGERVIEIAMQHLIKEAKFCSE